MSLLFSFAAHSQQQENLQGCQQRQHQRSEDQRWQGIANPDVLDLQQSDQYNDYIFSDGEDRHV